MTRETREHWVLCGGAVSTVAPDDALRLTWSGHKPNLTVDIAGMSTSVGHGIPPRFRDLIRIAAYVLAADQRFSRGGLDDVDGSLWRRNFHFVVSVEDPDFWQSETVVEQLQSTLTFLTEDYFTFEFVRTNDRPPEQLGFHDHEDEGFTGLEQIEAVQLFSGGMDSLAGAAARILAEGKRVGLVSHRSSDKVTHWQRDLVRKIRARAPNAVPAHVAIRVEKHAAELRHERTQRSRSFLFASMAGAVAQVAGLGSIQFYENGITSIHVPFSADAIGARTSRTTHPEVLRGYSRLLGMVAERPLLVENPFDMKTRAEVLDVLRDAGALDLLKETVSCGKVHSIGSIADHCGVCDQCVDRRFSVVARGLERYDPADRYQSDLATGKRERDIDGRLVLDFVAAADRYADFERPVDFMSKASEAQRAVDAVMEAYSINAEEAEKRIFELHKRQGLQVREAIRRMMDQNDLAIRTPGALDPTSLLARLVRQGQADGNPPLAVPTCAAPSDSIPIDTGDEPFQFRRCCDHWIVRFRGGRRLLIKPSAGMDYYHELLSNPEREFSAHELMVSCGRISAAGSKSAIAKKDAEQEDSELHVSTPTAAGRESVLLGVDPETITAIRKEIRQLEDTIEIARECGDDAAVAKHESEIQRLAEYLKQEQGRGPRVGRESLAKKRPRTAVDAALRRARNEIGKRSKLLADHLRDQVQSGNFLRYRDTSTNWDTRPTES